jgi:hypothetical protein
MADKCIGDSSVWFCVDLTVAFVCSRDAWEMDLRRLRKNLELAARGGFTAVEQGQRDGSDDADLIRGSAFAAVQDYVPISLFTCQNLVRCGIFATIKRPV